ncbi:clan AA aspartic protease, TIGR02281 family protein [Lyngbya aestuarii BL J]|uniref:Clan AA aspartic protease, TIGR02281 family protein n=1 Tax=Lyngbya aestuarii BL J TaxID=1348334 RepID=U7QEB7_9CYAN|nr:retropepsin-like aspartic protease [Lyngbya aestuarii]ERT06243.1 clan AA aspartic protease, TIGR02281 family protein [Lyngbya aestuarii BL J]
MRQNLQRFLLPIFVSIATLPVSANLNASVFDSEQPQKSTQFLVSLPEIIYPLPLGRYHFSYLTTDDSVLQQLNAIVQLKGLDFPPPRTQGQATIPLKQQLEGSQVFTVELTLGNQSGEFLLDTGASTTMLSTPMVERLGLEGEKVANEQLTSAVAGDDCPEMSATVHQLPTLTMDGVRVEELRGLEFTNTLIPGELSGVLGMDFLRHFDLNLNPKTQQLKLLTPSQLNSIQTQQAIPLKSRLGVMLAEIKINGLGPFTFMLDTGADTIFISPSLSLSLQLDQASRQEIQVIGFCGLEMAERSTLKQVKMGDSQQTNLEAVILSSPSVLDLLEVDGILGQNFLNHYEQYWRFNLTDESKSGNANNFEGSLILLPIYQNSQH